MNKIISTTLLFLLCTALFSCDEDDSNCPNGEREIELGNGTTTCVPDLTTPTVPLFP